MARNSSVCDPSLTFIIYSVNYFTFHFEKDQRLFHYHRQKSSSSLFFPLKNICHFLTVCKTINPEPDNISHPFHPARRGFRQDLPAIPKRTKYDKGIPKGVTTPPPEPPLWDVDSYDDENDNDDSKNVINNIDSNQHTFPIKICNVRDERSGEFEQIDELPLIGGRGGYSKKCTSWCSSKNKITNIEQFLLMKYKKSRALLDKDLESGNSSKALQREISEVFAHKKVDDNKNVESDTKEIDADLVVMDIGERKKDTSQERNSSMYTFQLFKRRDEVEYVEAYARKVKNRKVLPRVRTRSQQEATYLEILKDSIKTDEPGHNKKDRFDVEKPVLIEDQVAQDQIDKYIEGNPENSEYPCSNLRIKWGPREEYRPEVSSYIESGSNFIKFTNQENVIDIDAKRWYPRIDFSELEDVDDGDYGTALDHPLNQISLGKPPLSDFLAHAHGPDRALEAEYLQSKRTIPLISTLQNIVQQTSSSSSPSSSSCLKISHEELKSLFTPASNDEPEKDDDLEDINVDVTQLDSIKCFLQDEYDEKLFFHFQKNIDGTPELQDKSLESPELEIVEWSKNFVVEFGKFMRVKMREQNLKLSTEAGEHYIPLENIYCELSGDFGVDPNVDPHWRESYKDKTGIELNNKEIQDIFTGQSKTFVMKMGRFRAGTKRKMLIGLRKDVENDPTIKEEILDRPPPRPLYFDIEKASQLRTVDELLCWVRDFIPERNLSLRSQVGERIHPDAGEHFIPVHVLWSAIKDNQPRWGLRGQFRKRFKKEFGNKIDCNGLLALLHYYNETFILKQGYFVNEDVGEHPLVMVKNRFPYAEPSEYEDSDPIPKTSLYDAEMEKPKWAQDQYILRQFRRKEPKPSKVLQNRFYE